MRCASADQEMPRTAQFELLTQLEDFARCEDPKLDLRVVPVDSFL